jgi:hypothetical protein
MVILVAFLLVLLFAGLGFALHFLWIVAVVLLVVWLIGLVLGRGESAGNHRFYRW